MADGTTASPIITSISSMIPLSLLPFNSTNLSSSRILHYPNTTMVESRASDLEESNKSKDGAESFTWLRFEPGSWSRVDDSTLHHVGNRLGSCIDGTSSSVADPLGGGGGGGGPAMVEGEVREEMMNKTEVRWWRGIGPRCQGAQNK
ncbi:hypothetical protein CRG98_007574 [Punica granatum]|uniref:Uncharacterized protein n=1 Tax=Punica granatum TaxID=22663 RepID=A0A2I0KU77_PUNGR|nr:hypothetical protein CRG98_007574 [Punica granatum]